MKVDPLSVAKGMAPPASGRGATVSAPQEVLSRSLPLVQGQLLRGQVTGLTPEGKVLLEIDGRTFAARSEVALRPGSSLWFEVKQAEPLWLGLAEKKGAAQEFLRHYFLDPAALGKGVRTLLAPGLQQGSLASAGIAQALAAVAVGESAAPGDLLRLLTLLGPGSAFQPGQAGSRLRELASLLLQDKGEVVHGADPAALQRLGTLFELQSELNVLPRAPGQALFLLFPCFFAMGAGQGQWLFTLEQEKDADQGEQPWVLSFFLEMSQLGEVQIQVRVRGEKMHGEFVVATEPVLRHLEAQLAELQDLLTGLGYEPVLLSCRCADTSLLESLKESIERAAQLAATRIIDLQA